MPNYLTYGLEIEAVELTSSADRIISENGFSRHFDRTIVRDDGSQIDQGSGNELITQPLRATVSARGDSLVMNIGESVETVKALCSTISKVNKSCGIHIHLGLPVAGSSSVNRSKWSDEQIRTWISVGILLENKLFNLVPPSRLNNQYCKKVADAYSRDDLRKGLPMGNINPRKYDNSKRYCWLNLIETRRPEHNGRSGLGTVEVRLLGNTKRYDYILAWTKLWLKVAAYVGYMNSSQVILNVLSTGLDTEFAELKSAKDAPVNRRNLERVSLREDGYLQESENTARVQSATVASMDEQPNIAAANVPANANTGSSR